MNNIITRTSSSSNRNCIRCTCTWVRVRAGVDEYVQLQDAYAELEQENKDVEEQNIQLRVRSDSLADRVDTLEMDLQGFEFEKANLMKFVIETVGGDRAVQIARGV